MLAAGARETWEEGLEMGGADLAGCHRRRQAAPTCPVSPGKGVPRALYPRRPSPRVGWDWRAGKGLAPCRRLGAPPASLPGGHEHLCPPPGPGPCLRHGQAASMSGAVCGFSNGISESSSNARDPCLCPRLPLPAVMR